jgi:hypothetical protein
MMGFIAQGNLNIRIHRDITGEMWFGVDKTPYLTLFSNTLIKVF